MDLLDASVSFDAADFDPLQAIRIESTTMSASSSLNEDVSFSGHVWDIMPNESENQPTSAPVTPPVSPPTSALIDFCAPTPAPPCRTQLRPFLTSTSSYPPSTVKRPSPLQQAISFEDEEAEAEDETDAPADPAPLLLDVEATPMKAPPKRRWSVMQTPEMKTDATPELSPLVEDSPIRAEASSDVIAGDVSGFSDLNVGVAEDGDSLLLMNEAGSFLLNGSHDLDTTLGTNAVGNNLSGIVEEDEDEAQLSSDVLQILQGLERSSIDGRPTKPTATADEESILPMALTSSTRLALSRSIGRGEPPLASSDKALLACSTASYRDYRDSPARIVSITSDCAAFMDQSAATPHSGRTSGPNTPESEGSSTSFRDLLQDQVSGDTSSVDIFGQDLSESLLLRTLPTATFERGFEPPIALVQANLELNNALTTSTPAPQSPSNSLSASTSSVATVKADDSEPEAAASRPSGAHAAIPDTPARNGAERLRQRMEALRAAQAKVAKFDATPTASRLVRRPSETPRPFRGTALFKDDVVDLTGRSASTDLSCPAPSTKPALRTPRPSLSISGTPIRPAASTSKENKSPERAAASAPIPSSARKDSTRDRLDRLKEERLRRDSIARSPEKSVKRPAPSRPFGAIQSTAKTGAAGGLRRPAASTMAKTAPVTVGARPTLADALARKPVSSTHRPFVPTVRPSTSASARPKTSTGPSGMAVRPGVTALPRPPASTSGLPVPGSRIGRPSSVGAGIGSRQGNESRTGAGAGTVNGDVGAARAGRLR